MLPLLHPIDHAGGLPLACELVFGAAQEVADLDVAALVFLVGGPIDLLQPDRYLLQRHPLAAVGIAHGRAVGLLEDRKQLFAKLREALIAKVVFHQSTFFLTCQVVAEPQLRDFVLQLSIELFVLDGRGEVDVALDVDADEASAAAGVGQGHTLVGGADERRIAAVAGIGFAVGRAVLEVGGGDEVLQHNLLALGYLVELVEVDEGEAGQAEVQVALVLEVDAVVVVLALLPGQEDSAEGSLAATLSARHIATIERIQMWKRCGHSS